MIFIFIFIFIFWLYEIECINFSGRVERKNKARERDWSWICHIYRTMHTKSGSGSILIPAICALRHKCFGQVQASQLIRDAGRCPPTHLWVAIIIRNDPQLQVSFSNLAFIRSIGVDFGHFFTGSHQRGCSGRPNGLLVRNQYDLVADQHYLDRRCLQ